MALRDTDPVEVGGYPIEDRLGSGGMGVVYLARSASGRRLAVKVVHGQYADDPEFRTRFRREVAAARGVSGAFTAPVVDAGADAPRPWMATLYIPGADLGTHVRRDGPLPLPRLLELAAGLTEALRDIHRVGVVHRDLKPANVMLAEDGPRVIDFGVSRAAETLTADPLTQTGRVMGTPPYMSPEQLTSPRDVGPASDIFSLGSVLTYAATGRGPFDSDSPYETATGVVDGDPELGGIPDELRLFVAECLAKHPKERPTPDELLALLRGEPLPPPSARAAERRAPKAERPPWWRRRVAAAAAVGVALLAGLATGLVVWLPGDDPARRDVPSGWRAWQSQDPTDDASGSFVGCVAAEGGLVCAGDGVKAARFSLAAGKFAWSHPVDPKTDESTVLEGRVIGAAGDRFFVYRNNHMSRGDTETNDYAIQALHARTGRELWITPTQRGEYAVAPDPDQEIGGAAATDAGVLTTRGPEGGDYALLAARDGKVLWELPMPRGTCHVDAADGHGYLTCTIDGPGRTATTRVSRLDPTSGKPTWTVTMRGSVRLVGQAHGRLLFADEKLEEVPHHRITALDLSTRRARPLALQRSQSSDAAVTVGRGALYFTYSNGVIRAVDPRTGREAWGANSTVDAPGPPLASASHVYVASPNGRLAALDRRTGEVDWSRVSPSTGGGAASGWDTGAELTLVGDALYVPYGTRSVYSIDVRNP
ncbi:serine/threonine-protein kinase [Streptomyces lasiicapitis]|uniref:serine/threonine-protein kinase n=1 Tax=Streptomyces lasiicapitis TaxID=1923961 RepID=UPI003656A9E3